MQEFEKHENLRQHILRMASTGSVGSPSYWADFISDLNDALSSIERAVLAKAMEKIQSDATERSIQDYAIEHAEYMATSAEQLLNHLNECTNIDDCVIEPDENFSDYTSGLRLSIHDFRKRRDRAKAMPIPKQEPVGIIGETDCLNDVVYKLPIGTRLYTDPVTAQAAANPLVDAVFAASHKKATDTHGKCPHCSHECAQAAAIPEGWQLVPAEPTHGMCDAYCEHAIASTSHLSVRGYKAMLSASPKPE